MSGASWSRFASRLMLGGLLIATAFGSIASVDGYEETIRTARGVYVMRGNARVDELEDVASSSITAATPEGRVMFHRMTTLRPGCSDFRARLVDIGPEHQRTRIVLLCGSNGGPHETLFAFVDGTGLVAEVDGDRDFPSPHLSDNGELFAHSLWSGPIDGIDGLFVIPRQYRLRREGDRLEFEPIRGALYSPWAKETLEFYARQAARSGAEWPRYYVVAHSLLGDGACAHLRNERPDFPALIGDSMHKALNRWISSEMSLMECN